MAVYETKFEELSRYFSYYHNEARKHSKCVKSNIFDEDNKMSVIHYKSVALMKDKKFDYQNHKKPYYTYLNILNGGKVPSTPQGCMKCGQRGHIAYECKDKDVTCFNCGKQGHIGKNYPSLKRKPSHRSCLQAN
ncbi:hypothetical protein CR513_20856, partial [Mucuna pruriens]